MEKILEQLMNLVNTEDWIAARNLLDECLNNPGQEYTDVLGILETSVCIAEKRLEEAWQATERGLIYNPYNYELYYMQGQIKEMQQNYRAAYLCYLQSLFYVEGEEFDFLEQVVAEFQNAYSSYCQKIVVIASADDVLEKVQVCFDSIAKFTNPMLCEIVFVVKEQRVEVKEWLEKKDIVKTVNMKETEHYSTVRNRIIEAYEQADIFLLGESCALLPNTVHNVAMVLAQQDEIGMVATGEYEKDKIQRNANKICFYEPTGILIRREGLADTKPMDENLLTEKYATMDLAMSGLMQNRRNVMSGQSFVFRIGQRVAEEAKESVDSDYLISKWGIDIEYYNTARVDLISLITEEQHHPIRVLEIGCGTGATLLQIKKQFPNAEVYGMELQQRVVDFGSKLLPITCGNIEDRTLDFPKEYFDYIILGDVLEHLVNPEDTLVYLKNYLKEEGYILTSIPNLQHYSAFVPLLFGEFEYFDAGVLDRTHLRFFTYRSIQNMFKRIDYEIVHIKRNVDVSTMQPWVEEVLDKLCAISSEIDRREFITLQYCVKARKCERQ